METTREKQARYLREWRHKNRDKYKKYCKKYYEKNKEKIRAQQRKYDRKYREKKILQELAEIPDDINELYEKMMEEIT